MVWKSLCGYILSWYKVQLPRRLEGSYEPRSFLSRMEVCLLSTELEVQGFAALRILRKARVPWVPAWPRQSVGHRACASSTPPLWERQWDRSLGRFENWFKVTSPVSGGTRIPTEICFTCLHVYLLDFHIGRTGWWPSPLSWVNFPPNSSFFFRISASYQKLKLVVFATQVFLFQLIFTNESVFLQLFWKYCNGYQERFEFTFLLSV